MTVSPVFPLRIFYDGSCSVCASEVERYGRKDREGRLILVDISAPDFNADSFGIPFAEFMFRMHAIDRSGTVYRGVEAFWAIWQAFPGSTVTGLCGKLIMLPLVNPLARLCYRMFAAIRGYLPKRRKECTTRPCRIEKE